jgi:hypothetical protein
VYVVKAEQLHLMPVEVVRITETGAIIRGLEEGTQLLATPIAGAFEGMEVRLAKATPASVTTEGQ